MFDVAITFWSVLWLAIVGHRSFEHLEGFVERHRATCGDIEDLSRNFVGWGAIDEKRKPLAP
jgi:hypothetical protein